MISHSIKGHNLYQLANLTDPSLKNSHRSLKIISKYTDNSSITLVTDVQYQIKEIKRKGIITPMIQLKVFPNPSITKEAPKNSLEAEN